MSEAAPTSTSARELLRQRDYLCFWASRWMGGLGTIIQSVAMGWQVYDLSRRAHLSVNYASFNVPSINTQIGKLVTAGSAAQWNALDKQIIAGYAPWAPLLNPTRVTLFASGICGAIIQPVYLVDFATLGRCA